MWISLNQRPSSGDSNSLFNTLDKEDVHLVTTALKKSSFCMSFLEKKGISVTYIANWCDTINFKKEVGTFTQFRFTMVPLLAQGDDQAKVIHEYMDDVIKAHEIYYKSDPNYGKKGCKFIEFIFDKDSGYDFDLLTSQIEQYLSQKVNENAENAWLRDLEYNFKTYPE